MCDDKMGKSEGAKRRPQSTLVDRWLAGLKNNKITASVVLAVIIIIGFSRFTNAIRDTRRFASEFSEPLRVQISPLIPEPWLNLVLPNSPGVTQLPIPMWLMFYVTIHNAPDSSNIWISSYSVSAKTKNGWMLLTSPRIPLGKRTLFFMWPGNMQSLKAECMFDYNASKTPITSDGYLSGWMFFESRVTDQIKELAFEFRDKDGNLHRREVDAFTGYFGAGVGVPPPGFKSLEAPALDLEQDNGPLPPEFESYQREMRYYISFFPWLRGK
jgi:hypothetical protein